MSGLRPIESVQLRDRTFDSLHQAIISVELRPGQPLKDRELADALGVSRTPVREALHRLEAAGLVESHGRSGWSVSAFTEQDVHELFELRRLLEPVGLDHLEKHPDEAVIARIAQAFEGFEHPILPERFPEYFRADHAFHKLLVTCSTNRRIQRFYAVIESHIDRGRHYLSTGAVRRVDKTLDEHHAIAQAVAERDFARARDDLLSHLRTGEELMVEQVRLREAEG